MGQALYRKYRSRSLDEIVGQEAIVTSLKNALQSSNISHAYLFTGPRGVGKTSIARILAYAINEIPYENENLPLDIIEIDAASNRKIDEIRDLREKVHIAPLQAKYKVYIVDEVHMLTNDSFNALLKTLEEPPKHVIFILATTDAHKIPETILSRTQRYNFKLASKQQVADHLAKISQKEKIAIDNEALLLLAEHSGGSLRDALSLLDQVRHSGKQTVSADYVEKTLGLPANDLVLSIISSIEAGDIGQIFMKIQQSTENGISASSLASALANQLRQSLILAKNEVPKKYVLSLLADLLEVESSARPEVALEIAVLKTVAELHPHQESLAASKTVSAAISPPLTISRPAVNEKKPAKKANVTIEKQSPASENQIENKPIYSSLEMNITVWQTVLENLRRHHNTIYSVLRMAKLNESQLRRNIIELEFTFPFHQKRMSDKKNQKLILDQLALAGVNGYEIMCSLAEKKEDSFDDNYFSHENIKPEVNVLDQVKSIFGGAEVLE